jgi:hypothetical protein
MVRCGECGQNKYMVRSRRISGSEIGVESVDRKYMVRCGECGRIGGRRGNGRKRKEENCSGGTHDAPITRFGCHDLADNPTKITGTVHQNTLPLGTPLTAYLRLYTHTCVHPF